ncbi:helix-turn-helix transcriptional regulator [Paenibacillus larvae]
MKIILNKKILEKYMIEKGWNERELARQIGVSNVQVYRVLRKQRYPGNDFLAGLKKACPDISFDELIEITSK